MSSSFYLHLTTYPNTLFIKNSSSIFKFPSPHHIPTNAYILAFVGFCFLRKLPLSIVCPLFLNVLCISPKFLVSGSFFKPFFHHFYLCFYGNPVLRIQRYLPSLALLKHMAVTDDGDLLSIRAIARILNP